MVYVCDQYIFMSNIIFLSNTVFIIWLYKDGQMKLLFVVYGMLSEGV